MLAKPGDPYIDSKGEVIESDSSPSPTTSPVVYARVPKVLEHQPTVARSIRDMPSTNPTTQHGLFVVLGYWLSGLTKNEIAHAIGVELAHVEELMNSSEFQETFSIMFEELISSNSKSMMAKVQHYSHQAMDRVIALSQEADRDMVSLKASQDVLDRAGMVPSQDMGSSAAQQQGLRIVVQKDNNDEVKVDINLRR